MDIKYSSYIANTLPTELPPQPHQPVFSLIPCSCFTMYLGNTGLDFFRGTDFLSPLLFKMVLGMNTASMNMECICQAKILLPSKPDLFISIIILYVPQYNNITVSMPLSLQYDQIGGRQIFKLYLFCHQGKLGTFNFSLHFNSIQNKLHLRTLTELEN